MSSVLCASGYRSERSSLESFRFGLNLLNFRELFRERNFMTCVMTCLLGLQFGRHATLAACYFGGY